MDYDTWVEMRSILIKDMLDLSASFDRQMLMCNLIAKFADAYPVFSDRHNDEIIGEYTDNGSE
jgi:hypothetical protein